MLNFTLKIIPISQMVSDATALKKSDKSSNQLINSMMNGAWVLVFNNFCKEVRYFIIELRLRWKGFIFQFECPYLQSEGMIHVLMPENISFIGKRTCWSQRHRSLRNRICGSGLARTSLAIIKHPIIVVEEFTIFSLVRFR